VVEPGALRWIGRRFRIVLQGNKYAAVDAKVERASSWATGSRPTTSR
jgi:hypothetical protein